MEFASEMVIRATRENLDVREVPIELHPRVGDVEAVAVPRRLATPPSHRRLQPELPLHRSRARSCSSPASLISLLVFLDVPILGRDLQIHSLIFGCLLVLLGVQAIGLGLCARAYGVYFISDQDPSSSGAGSVQARARSRSGAVFAVAGIALFGVVSERGRPRIRRAAGGAARHRGATLIAVAAQVFFTSFLLSILGLRWRDTV